MPPTSIALKDGLLEITANGADLPRVLRRIEEISGMMVDGSVTSSRVDGVFGPGDPTEVIHQLLVGTGYNYMMVGLMENGAPRQLRLMPKNGKASPPEQAQTTAMSHAEVHTESGTFEEIAGPGAILHVPPPPPEETQERVRLQLQRLQQMHDSMMKQAQPQ